MKILLLIALLVCGPPFVFAKPLLIGTSPLNPPFETLAEKPNRFYGFDIDIMMEICRRIQHQCEFTPVIFSDLFPFVKEGKLDLAISSIIITPERKADFLFSVPYLESNARFLALKNTSIKNREEMKKAVIGTRRGTPFLALIQTIYHKSIQAKEYPLIASLMEDLHDGKVDVVLLDDESALFWVNNNMELYKFIGNKIPVGSGYGIMANPAQTQLINNINQALLAMEADGKYLEIYQRYFDREI